MTFADVRNRAENGESDNTIADAFGVRLHVIAHYRRNYGIESGTKIAAKRRWDKIETLFKNGKTPREVAQIVGLAESTAKHYYFYLKGERRS